MATASERVVASASGGVGMPYAVRMAEPCRADRRAARAWRVRACIDRRIGGEQVQRAFQQVRLEDALTGYVQRVADVAELGHDLAQFRLSLVGQLRKANAAVRGQVGHQSGRAA